jgi:hypothetical protein
MAGGTVGPPAGAPAFDASILGPVGKAEIAALRLAPPSRTIVPLQGDGTGQSGWYETTWSTDITEITVKIGIGWGACPTGCANTHRWFYVFDGKAQLTQTTEFGPQPIPSVAPTGQGGPIEALMVLGSPCPLVPPAGAAPCFNRPLAGASLHVRSLDNPTDLGFVANASGIVELNLAPGLYLMNANPPNGAKTPRAEPVLVVVGPDEATVVFPFQ